MIHKLYEQFVLLQEANEVEEASSHETPPNRLAELAMSPRNDIKMAVAGNAATPAHVFHSMIGYDPEKGVIDFHKYTPEAILQAVAKNPNADLGVLMQLAEHGMAPHVLQNPIFPMLLLENPAVLNSYPAAAFKIAHEPELPEAFLDLLTDVAISGKDKNKNIAFALAERSDITPQIADRLYDAMPSKLYSTRKVREHLLDNPVLSDHFSKTAMDKIGKLKNSEDFTAWASFNGLPEDAVEKLYDMGDPRAFGNREILLRNPAASNYIKNNASSLIKDASDHSDSQTLSLLAQHPDVSFEHTLGIASKAEPDDVDADNSRFVDVQRGVRTKAANVDKKQLHAIVHNTSDPKILDMLGLSGPSSIGGRGDEPGFMHGESKLFNALLTHPNKDVRNTALGHSKHFANHLIKHLSYETDAAQDNQYDSGIHGYSYPYAADALKTLVGSENPEIVNFIKKHPIVRAHVDDVKNLGDQEDQLPIPEKQKIGFSDNSYVRMPNDNSAKITQSGKRDYYTTQAASMPWSSKKTYNFLSQAENPRVREALSKNPNVPAETLHSLAHDPHPKVRLNVASHPNTHPQTLDVLRKDKDENVRQHASDMYNTLERNKVIGVTKIPKK